MSSDTLELAIQALRGHGIGQQPAAGSTGRAFKTFGLMADGGGPVRREIGAEAIDTGDKTGDRGVAWGASVQTAAASATDMASSQAPNLPRRSTHFGKCVIVRAADSASLRHSHAHRRGAAGCEAPPPRAHTHNGWSSAVALWWVGTTQLLRAST